MKLGKKLLVLNFCLLKWNKEVNKVVKVTHSRGDGVKKE